MNQGLTPESPANTGIHSDRYSSINSNHTNLRNPPSNRLSRIGSILAKSVLFACSQCDGPLVPSSYCIVCKKTAIRCCNQCGTIRDMGIHDSCKDVIILGNEVSHNSFEINSKEKNN